MFNNNIDLCRHGDLLECKHIIFYVYTSLLSFDFMPNFGFFLNSKLFNGHAVLFDIFENLNNPNSWQFRWNEYTTIRQHYSIHNTYYYRAVSAAKVSNASPRKSILCIEKPYSGFGRPRHDTVYIHIYHIHLSFAEVRVTTT